ncbi:MAG: PQQ-dependent sugar dehydrogenase, partial [Tunicatimonas sp.]|uniref:PQQ-dependent sugar dehydrogenase n=1 Tax=Tunicatimonas sp. TaxID=1940096 RepID=UPI003C706831
MASLVNQPNSSSLNPMYHFATFGKGSRSNQQRTPSFLWRSYAISLLMILSQSLWLASPSYAQVTFENALPALTFEFPVEIQNSGVSGDDRLFVVGQRGNIRVADNNASISSAQQFLDIESDVLFNVGQELGLLGLAFHPDYEANGFFYVYYTRAAGSTSEIIIERFEVSSGNPNQANKSSRQIVFSAVKNQNNSNHNGGKIAFGPDGYLYISIGDGGGGGDPKRNGQNTDTYFGSILRLDIDLNGDNPADANGLAPEGRYEVPSSNPLVGQDGLDEIYAWGIRNTWKMSFDPPTGRLWGGDVGQGSFEEINLIEPGNFGWNRYEGNSVYNSNVPDPENPIFPAFAYNRSSGDRSVTGGYVYRGSQVTSTSPSIAGKYIFGDYVSGRVWALDYNATTQEATRELLFKASNGSSINVSTFGLDINGEMYFAGYGSSGSIYRLKDGSTSQNAVAVAGVGDWSSALGSIQGEVNAIVTADDQTIYIGGNFSQVGSGVAANNVAKWTSSDGWQSLGAGTNGVVNALALTTDGSLYVGGSFTTAGNNSANNVAKYSSSQNWEALNGGVSGAVLAMTTTGNTLYVGGTFVTADGQEANNVAQWNNGWSSLQDSNTQQAGTNNEIRSMAVDEAGNLYVGGNFGSAGGNSASRIAQWNGSEWSALGAGTSGFVQSILITDDYIYAGGNFAIAGGQTVNRIARWDRSASAWAPLEDGLSNSVNTMTTDGEYIYVAGQFNNALNTGSEDNIVVNSVVRWSETSGWQALGEDADVGVDNYVNTLYLNGSKLYVGGRFEEAGNLNAQNLATWLSPQDPPVASVVFEAGKIDIQQSSRSYWQTVNLTKTFTQPIVIISPPTFNGSQPTTVRIRNVSSNSFEVQLNEWDYLDGWHVEEELNYLVIEEGNHTFGGLQLEAGRLTTDENFETQSFAQSFSSSPVVLVQTASDNEASAAAPRLQNISTTGFDAKFQEEEAADDLRPDESLHYVAIASGTGSEDNWDIEAASGGTSFTHQWRKIEFQESYSGPLFFAAIQTYQGRDPATLRYRRLNSSSAEVKVEEEQSRDNEVKHINETVAFLVLNNQTGNAANSNASRTSPSLGAKVTSDAELRLYPNPVKIGESVTFTGLSTEQDRLTIYNAQGQVMWNQEMVNQPRLETADWQPGLYIVR